MRHGIRPSEEAGQGTIITTRSSSNPRSPPLCIAPASPRRALVCRREQRGRQDKLRRLLWYARIQCVRGMVGTQADPHRQTATSTSAPAHPSSSTSSASLPTPATLARLLPLYSHRVCPRYTRNLRGASTAHARACSRSSYYRESPKPVSCATGRSPSTRCPS
jgi:hypothetical protein